jgi:mono/diheme cytochrome c family protein
VGLVKKILLILLFLTFTSSVFADDKMVLGLDIYNNKAQCGVCHTLQTAGSTGTIGPNLDQLKPQMSQIIAAVTDGIGVMQAWDGILTYEEIEAVSYFVFKSTNK